MTKTHFQSLHDRATRGEPLTTDEQAMLDAWYSQEDQAESELLISPASEMATQLRDQVAAAAAQLESISQHIRVAVAENEQVRREISLLQRQLSQHANRAA